MCLHPPGAGEERPGMGQRASKNILLHISERTRTISFKPNLQ